MRRAMMAALAAAVAPPPPAGSGTLVVGQDGTNIGWGSFLPNGSGSLTPVNIGGGVNTSSIYYYAGGPQNYYSWAPDSPGSPFTNTVLLEIWDTSLVLLGSYVLTNDFFLGYNSPETNTNHFVVGATRYVRITGLT